MKEARYYQEHEHGVICALCPKQCIIGQDKTGFCRVRKNVNGKLYTENYGYCSSCALDPIEKKPLYHFYPGSTIFSIGTWGCNFACQFCQNWEIAQAYPKTISMLPKQAVDTAMRAGQGNIGIAYTYSEPSVWYEYILDTARIAQDKGLKNVIVTNGFINMEPLKELLPFVDAMNIDVKAFNTEFYRSVCGGTLKHVMQTVQTVVSRCHVEVTTLVIPGMNDSEPELRELAEWLAGLNKDIPLHFSRYFPRYKMEAAATPLSTLKKAYEIASEYLNYVYIGNAGEEGTNTHCPHCRLLIIDRVHGCSRLGNDRNCPCCGKHIAIQGEISFPGI